MLTYRWSRLFLFLLFGNFHKKISIFKQNYYGQLNCKVEYVYYLKDNIYISFYFVSISLASKSYVFRRHYFIILAIWLIGSKFAEEARRRLIVLNV